MINIDKSLAIILPGALETMRSNPLLHADFTLYGCDITAKSRQLFAHALKGIVKDFVYVLDMACAAKLPFPLWSTAYQMIVLYLLRLSRHGKWHCRDQKIPRGNDLLQILATSRHA